MNNNSIDASADLMREAFYLRYWQVIRMNHGTILVVDDDSKIAGMLKRSLEYEGYQVAVVHTGEDALIYLLEKPVDLVILDIMLPGLSGWEVCQEVRRTSSTPIIMLTAKDEIGDRVRGLDYGADDYVAKPFALEELLARIRALLRRHSASLPSASSLEFQDIVLRVESRECFRGEHKILLKGKEFDLLEVFMRHPNQILSKEQLINQVWGYDYQGDSSVVEVYVASLRAKLESHGGQRVIHTVRGLGYILKGAS